jgi:hypothetical protein
LFVGVLPLVSESPARRAACGLLLAMGSLLGYRELEPFASRANNALVYLAQVAVLLTFGSALAIAAGLSEGFDPAVFGAGLVALNLGVLAAALAMAAGRARALAAEQEARRRRRATKVEWAVDFAGSKWATTLDAVEASAGASACLVFWYGSLASVERALACGIPTSGAQREDGDCGQGNEGEGGEGGKGEGDGGVVFSLHRPHELDEADRWWFPSREAVLVSALPRRLCARAALARRRRPPAPPPAARLGAVRAAQRGVPRLGRPFAVVRGGRLLAPPAAPAGLPARSGARR